MSLFRSEEHVERWLIANDAKRGEVLSLQQVWKLAKAWYSDPRERTWRRRTREETQGVLTSVGLAGEFWQLG